MSKYSNWLDTHFPTQPNSEINIEYFRSLRDDPNFQKIKPILISQIEQEPDYYIMHFIYMFIHNIIHGQEFYDIMMDILFKDIRCFTEGIVQHYEAINKLRTRSTPESESESESDPVPPPYAV